MISQSLFSGKNKTNIVNLLSAELVQRVVKVQFCKVNECVCVLYSTRKFRTDTVYTLIKVFLEAV